MSDDQPKRFHANACFTDRSGNVPVALVSSTKFDSFAELERWIGDRFGILDVLQVRSNVYLLEREAQTKKEPK